MQYFERAAELAGALQARIYNARFPLSKTSEGEIRQGVSDYADELKEIGVSPEHAILAVKRAANSAGLYATARIPGTTVALGDGDKLLADMVRWCIDGYYGPPSRAD